LSQGIGRVKVASGLTCEDANLRRARKLMIVGSGEGKRDKVIKFQDNREGINDENMCG